MIAPRPLLKGNLAVNSILAAEPSSSLFQVPSLFYYSYISLEQLPSTDSFSSVHTTFTVVSHIVV